MPRWLTLLRHGESQANLIQRASKKGLITEYPEAFLRTPDREIRLSRRGREQAELTGKWMAKEYPHGFDVILVSNHVRAMETAAIVCKAAGWTKTAMRLDPLLGERNWGGVLPGGSRAKGRADGATRARPASYAHARWGNHADDQAAKSNAFGARFTRVVGQNHAWGDAWRVC